MASNRGTPRPGSASREAVLPPLSPREIEALQRLLDAVPAPLEPLDVVMLDGYLCGVLLQPEPVAAARWWPHVLDVDARPVPSSFEASRLQAAVERRRAELDRAIQGRRWFDPWIFELEDAAGAAPTDDGDDDDAEADADMRAASAASDAVYPWVAGFASALENFPALLDLPDEALTEPLALLYRHLDPDDLEDAEALLEAIEQIGPAVDLADAVEGLVRAVLLLADVTRPLDGARG